MTCARSLAHLCLHLWLVSIGLLGRKVDGAKFLAKFFMGTHAWVLSASDLGIVEVGEFWKGTQIHVVPQMAEQSRRYSPSALVSACLLLVCLDILIENALCGVSINNLVEATKDVASCDPLKHDTSLHE